MTERHHRSTKVKKYIEQPADYVKAEYVQVKLSDLKEILRVSVCDEVREIVAKYL